MVRKLLGCSFEGAHEMPLLQEKTREGIKRNDKKYGVGEEKEKPPQHRTDLLAFSDESDL